MSLLVLENVSKVYTRGLRERAALRGVSFEVDCGELVVVWGIRGSGRSTLMRIAAGVEPPDAGSVRFEGVDLSSRGASALGAGIAYCRTVFRAAEGRSVLERIMNGQLGCGIPLSVARSNSRSALERAGVEQCASLSPHELDAAETARVSIARALAFQPRLIIFDEPTKGVDLLQRDGILLLLRSLADEGIAVLASTGEGSGLSGTNRALSLSEGELCGLAKPHIASVTPFRRPAASG